MTSHGAHMVVFEVPLLSNYRDGACSCFFDRDGKCMADPISKRLPEYQKGFAEKFHSENFYPDHVADVTVVFAAKINKEEYSIVGWYRHADLYLDRGFHFRFGTDSYAACDTKDAVLLPQKERPTIRLPEFSEFLFPSVTQKREFLLLIAARRNKTPVDIHISISAPELIQWASPEAQEKLLNVYSQTLDAGLLPQIYGHAKEWAQREPNEPAPLLYMIKALLELGYPEEALECCEKLLALENTNEADKDSAIKNKGTCLFRLQRHMESAGCFRSLLEKNPKDKDAKNGLVDAYLFDGYPGIAYDLLKEFGDPSDDAFIAELERDMPYLVKENQELSVLAPHPIYIPFSEEPLPRTDTDDKRVARFLDPVRQKFVQVTPEETIRQQVISYLINQSGVPKEYILVEESLAHIDRELKQRVDVLVWYLKENKRKYLLLVECKKSDVSLEGETTEQALAYNKYLAAPFILLTNDAQSLVYHYNKTERQYEALQNLPSFEEMCSETGLKNVPRSAAQWVRPTYDELYKPEFIRRRRQEYEVGAATPDAMVPFILNMKYCLLDDQERILCPLAVPGCVITEDNGVVPRKIGNASGGGYPGNYRWLGAKDRFGKKRQAYLAVFDTGSDKNIKTGRVSGGYTSLICGIDEKNKIVSRLQIRLDDCLKPQNNGFRLTHTGVRAGKPAEPLLQYVSQQAPELIGADGKIDMGWLDGGNNLYLSDTWVAEIIGRVISYLILRSEFREVESR